MSQPKDAKPPTTVFYSWQSDLPMGANRNLIETALERAVRVIRSDGSLAVEPRVDQGTQGVPGAPDIAHTIFEKIGTAGAFVADVSIINPGAGGRPTPNPNVLIELGYALHALKKECVVLVMNTTNGPVESLPFDLRGRRVLTYQLSDGVGDKPEERAKLQKGLELALRAIFSETKPSGPSASEPTAAEKAFAAIEAGAATQGGLCTRFMQELAARVQELTPIYTRDKADTWDAELVAAIERTRPVVEDFARLCDAAAMQHSRDAATGLFRGFAPLFALYEPTPGPGGSFFLCSADLPKFIGYELLVILVSAFVWHRRWDVVGDLCHETVTIPERNSRFSATKLATYLHAAEPLECSRQRDGRALAELLRQRHEQGRLGALSPFDRFLEGDVFLFLRSGVETDKADGYDFWRPWSAPLLTDAPSYLREARSLRKAQALLGALGAATVQELKILVQQAADKLVQLFGQRGYYRPFGGTRLDEIGTKP